MFRVNIRRQSDTHTHTPKHMLSLSFHVLSTSLEMGVSQMGRSLVFGSVNFKEPVWVIIMSFPHKKSPLERVSVLSAGLYVSMHAFSSAPVNKNNGLFIVACSMGVISQYANFVFLYLNLVTSTCEILLNIMVEHL